MVHFPTILSGVVIQVYDMAKVQEFIQTLDEEEIASQINDLFSFMEEYKQLLLKEQAIRRNRRQMTYGEQSDKPDITVPIEQESEDNQEMLEDVSLDFNVVNAIQNKVSKFTADELLENMKELDEIISKGPLLMPTQVFEEYRVARDACELKYFDEYQCEPIVCSHCGSYLRPKQKFCGKCGSSVPQA